MLDIYSYTEGFKYLRDSWREKQEKNPAFSLRAWARTLGLESHAPLHLMISGKRGVPKKHVPMLIEHLGLGPKEGLYFETLLEIDRAKDPNKKEFYSKRLRELNPKPMVRMFEVEQFTYLRDPIHTIVLEMTDAVGFTPDPQAIAKRLRFTASLRRIEEAIERLIVLGLLKEDTDGSLKKTHRHLTSVPDVTNKAVQEYHQNVSRLAAEMIAVQSVEEREFNGYSFNIKKSALPLAKKMIREFTKHFIEVVEARPGDGELTYQMNVQFFSLTRCQDKGAKKGRLQNENTRNT